MHTFKYSERSPGGSARSRAEKKLPVLAFIEDVGASGGYWLALAADEIFADPSSIVGSIGVIHASFGFAGVLDRLGIERRLYTAGAKKSMLDPFRPENPEDVERLSAILHELHQGFKTTVRERRGERLKGGDEELFEGQIWTGRGALETGLIDGLGGLHMVLKARFGDKVRLPQMSARETLVAAPARARGVAARAGRCGARSPRRARALVALRTLRALRPA